MDTEPTEIAIKVFIRQILERLDEAARVAKAANACAEAGNVEQAVKISLEIEQPINEATALLNAASLINRIGET